MVAIKEVSAKAGAACRVKQGFPYMAGAAFTPYCHVGMAVRVMEHGRITASDVQLVGGETITYNVELCGPGKVFQFGFMVVLVSQNVPTFDLEIELLDAVADCHLKIELGGKAGPG